MTTRVKPRWIRPNDKRSTCRAVYARLAELEGIAESTARDQFVGYLTPAERLAGRLSNQIAACQDVQRYDMIVELLMDLWKVALGIPPDWETAKHDYDVADSTEETDQADFDHLERMGLVKRLHWVRRRRVVSREIARAQRYIAAGDQRFLA